MAGPPGAEIRGTVDGLAPAAGAAEIDLEFHQREPGVEFAPVELTAGLEIKVARLYIVGIDWIEVGNPRNGPDTAAVHHLDYVLGACSATLGGQPLPRPQTSKDSPEEQATLDPFTHIFGRHGAKDVVPTSFQFGPFGGVPGETPDIKLNYIFNHSDYAGGGREQALAVLDWLSKIGKVIGEATIPSIGAAWKGLDDAINFLNSALFASCDGVVAAASVVLPGVLLDRLTSDVGDYAEIRHDPGRNSPAICGATSNYYVRFSVNRVSFVGSKVIGGPFGGTGGAPFEER